MTKDQIVGAVAEKVGFEQSDVSTVIDATIEQITGGLADGDTVHLGPLGTFLTRHEGEHETFLPGSDEEKVLVPAQNRILFHPSVSTKAAVNTDEDD